MNTRLRNSISSFVMLCVVFSSMIALAANVKAEEKKELFHNEDCTNFFYFHAKEIAQGKAGEAIDRYVDVIADAGVTTLLCNTNARRTNYRSEVWDSFWDGYDPNASDDQPFWGSLKPADIAVWKERYVDGMRNVYEQGIDYPARVVQRCRKRGVSPWISLRMNDCHCNNIPDHPFHGRFWKENPNFKRQNCTGYFATCLDYARPEVRDYYMALIEETLARYDIDGLELDFMREPYLFSAGKEAEGAPILTEWIRSVRKKVDAAAVKRGHPIQLGVRVPSRPETASKMGLQAIPWAQEGLIDLLVVTPRWATIEFDIPMEQWKELLEDSKTKLAAGLEIGYQPYPGAARSSVTPEMAAGAAATMLERGADAIYLFNYFQDGNTNWAPPSYQKVIVKMASLDSLLETPRRVGITYRDIVALGETYRPPLPATGEEVILPIRLGPIAEKNRSCELLLGMKTSEKSSSTPPAVTINGTACEVLSDKTSPKTGRLLTFRVPLEALKHGTPQTIKVTSPNATPLTIQRVEMSLQ